MPNARFLLKVSRPRFWLYIFGPYLVGLVAGAASRMDFTSIAVAAFAIYFLFPANLLIYGVNDIFDFETDKLNPKKQEYETLVHPKDCGGLVLVILLLNMPFVIAAFFMNSTALFAMACFLLFSVFYSAWPIRAKAIPIIDSMFNVLYVFPGIFAYAVISGEFPPILSVVAAFLWTMAMHAYSAIPDIKADTEAGVETIATFLGENRTLFFCAACYLGSAILAFPFLGVSAGLLGMVYLTLMAISIFAKGEQSVFGVYKYFPVINSAAGFILFWLVALQKTFQP